MKLKPSRIISIGALVVMLLLLIWTIWQNAMYAARLDTSIRSTVMLDWSYLKGSGTEAVAVE